MTDPALRSKMAAQRRAWMLAALRRTGFLAVRELGVHQHHPAGVARLLQAPVDRRSKGLYRSCR